VSKGCGAIGRVSKEEGQGEDEEEAKMHRCTSLLLVDSNIVSILPEQDCDHIFQQQQLNVGRVD
jgi:hypothetical protein